MVPSLSLIDDAFNLDPPPPRASHANPVNLADRLFSLDHLGLILRNHSLCQPFAAFLNRYQPQYTPTLTRYLDCQKALAAIRYANSVADRISMSCQSSKRESGVADPRLDTIAQKAIEELASEALPAYITCRLVSVVTDVLVKEITGNNIPLMRDMVQGLAEVYCMTDPTLPDNPIIFASKGLCPPLIEKIQDVHDTRRCMFSCWNLFQYNNSLTADQNSIIPLSTDKSMPLGRTVAFCKGQTHVGKP